MKPAVLLTITRGIGQLGAALLDRADLELIIFHETMAPLLERRGIPHRCFHELLTAELRLRIAREAISRAEVIAKALFSSEMRARWPQFDNTTWAALRAEITRILREDLSQEIIIIDLLRRWAHETDLRLVIVQEDICRDTKTLVYAARQLGIPSLHTLHGFPYGAVNAITMGDPSNADVVAVFSNRAKTIYESFGLSPDRIVVTGNFEWDVYTRPLKPDHRAAACQSLGLDPGRPVVVYALTYIHRFSKISASHPLYSHLTADAVMDAFVALAQRHPDWQFVLRPHPNDPETPNNLLERATRAGLEQVRIDPGMAQLPCLAMTDVMVCTQSNLGIEAILAGKPVVNCVIDEFGKAVFDEGIGPLFLDDDAVLFARTVEDIAPSIEAALLDPKTRQSLRRKRSATTQRFNHLNDGKATERLCALIFDMINNGSRHVTRATRYPEFEPTLARCVPAGAQEILVIGRAARHVADAVRSSRGQGRITELESFSPSTGNAKYHVVVLADPVPYSAEGEDLLQNARKVLDERGALVAPFRPGLNAEAGEVFQAGAWVPSTSTADRASALRAFSRRGMEIVLSRCRFEPDTVEAVVTTACGERADDTAIEGWVVRARVKEREPGPLARAEAERKRRADKRNRHGEALLREGKYEEAAREFVAAIKENVCQPAYFNNLGVALQALGQADEAWLRFRQALHCDPNFQPARDNLRAAATAMAKTAEAERILRLFGSDDAKSVH